jgi:hypothetical protein
MKLLRQIHLFLGVFFTPMLLFFVGTGWYQTVNHDRLKSPGDAETLVQKFRVVHTDQIYPTEHEIRRPSSPKLFRALVVVMSAAIVSTTVIGIILAFRFSRKIWAVWLCLGLGLAVPAALLWFGHPS